MQPAMTDGLEIQGTPTHLIIRLERKSLRRKRIVLKEHGKPIATLIPVSLDEDVSEEAANGTAEQSAEAPKFPEFEQEIRAFEAMKPELLKQYLGQAVAIFQGKVVATGKNKKNALRNAEKKMGPIRCYVEWVESSTPREVSSPSIFVTR